MIHASFYEQDFKLLLYLWTYCTGENIRENWCVCSSELLLYYKDLMFGMASTSWDKVRVRDQPGHLLGFYRSLYVYILHGKFRGDRSNLVHGAF